MIVQHEELIKQYRDKIEDLDRNDVDMRFQNTETEQKLSTLERQAEFKGKELTQRIESLTKQVIVEKQFKEESECKYEGVYA